VSIKFDSLGGEPLVHAADPSFLRQTNRDDDPDRLVFENDSYEMAEVRHRGLRQP
jgi:hypothetical protein